MSHQSFFARWLHLLTSNGAERVNIPPHASYPYSMLSKPSPDGQSTKTPPTK